MAKSIGTMSVVKKKKSCQHVEVRMNGCTNYDNGLVVRTRLR
jgi:hypothetical protein